jgi:hypothetical protein
VIDSARSWIEPCRQENYTKRYHRLILKLAQEGQFCSRSLKRLRELVRQFELEASCSLRPSSALSLPGAPRILGLERIIAGDESDEGEARSYVYRRTG